MKESEQGSQAVGVTEARQRPGLQQLWHIGDFQVDTGTAIIGDPCNLEREDLWPDLWPHLEQSDTACLIGSNGMGEAVAFQTGMGDGIYPVLGEFEEGPFGKVLARIFVEFTNPLRGKGCSKPYPHPWCDDCVEGDV